MPNLASFRKFMDSFMGELMRYGFNVAQAKEQANMWLQNNVKEANLRQQLEKEITDYRAEATKGVERVKSGLNIEEKMAGFKTGVWGDIAGREIVKDTLDPAIAISENLKMLPQEAQDLAGISVSPERRAVYAQGLVPAMTAFAKSASPGKLNLPSEQLAAIVQNNPAALFEGMDKMRTAETAGLDRDLGYAKNRTEEIKALASKVSAATAAAKEKAGVTEDKTSLFYKDFIKPKTNEVLSFLAAAKKLAGDDFDKLAGDSGVKVKAADIPKLMARISELDSEAFKTGKLDDSKISEIDNAYTLMSSMSEAVPTPLAQPAPGQNITPPPEKTPALQVDEYGTPGKTVGPLPGYVGQYLYLGKGADGKPQWKRIS